MENEIQEIIENYFNEKIKINVKFIDFNIYNINVDILGKHRFIFDYSINNNYTLNSNCIGICEKIESLILNLFIRGEEND